MPVHDPPAFGFRVPYRCGWSSLDGQVAQQALGRSGGVATPARRRVGGSASRADKVPWSPVP